MSKDIVSSTAERLDGYYPFGLDVIRNVAEFAEKQADYRSYQDLFDAVHIGATETLEYKNHEPVDIIDIRPPEHDPKAAMLIHLAMANPLDANQLYQLATIAGTNPNKRIIAVANPSGPGYKSGRLSRQDRQSVSRGFLLPIFASSNRYIDDQNIEELDEIGYSLGAQTAVESASHNKTNAVRNIVAIEPVVPSRSALRLALDFASTNKHLNDYVEANNLDSFKQARKDAVGLGSYVLGLARPTNLAVARGLARAHFETGVEEALETQSHSKIMIAWGTKSELADDKNMTRIVTGLEESYPGRVDNIRLSNQKHALANDVHLQAAIVLEGTPRF